MAEVHNPPVGDNTLLAAPQADEATNASLANSGEGANPPVPSDLGEATSAPLVTLDEATNGPLANHGEGAVANPFRTENAPQAPFMDSSRAPSSAGVRDSALADSTVALGPLPNSAQDDEDPPKEAADLEQSDEEATSKPVGRRRLLFALAALLLLAIVVIAVVVPVYFTVVKPRQERSSPSSSSNGDETTSAPRPTSTDSGETPSGAVLSGGDDSTVTTEDGGTFVYKNRFGGFWYSDPDDPYNDSAQPNSWTPPLNASFDYAANRIFGVNLGGLFVLEPFISPALFQKYPGAADEWDLSIAMAADTANGGLNQLEDHYATFITEQDIAEIAGAGLNWIRLPIAYWAVDTWPGEPFLARTSWKYIVRVFQWCRKYGIRVNLDLHTVPGSANGYNHGGKANAFNFLNGAMGMANAQRTLYYIQVITEFINQPEWRNVVPMFSVMNEPIMGTIGESQLRSFYIEVHRMMREITGFGAGNGPYVALHDGFQAPSAFAGFMRGADRVVMDFHPYFAFGGATDPATIDSGVGVGAGGPWPSTACERFGSMVNNSRTAFGVTVAGEWSLAWNDCGLFLRGTTTTPAYGGGCATWDDSSAWTDGVKAGLMAFASAQMDGLSDWFFWTWRIGESERGIVESPFWSYKLGLNGGWIPTDPRTASGTCAALGQSGVAWSGTFEPYMIGGTGAGAPDDAGSYPWPPPTLANGLDVAALPTYTSTGTPVILPAPTFTDSRGDAIVSDNQAAFPAPTPVAGCLYSDGWASDDLPAPGACVAA